MVVSTIKLNISSTCFFARSLPNVVAQGKVNVQGQLPNLMAMNDQWSTFKPLDIAGAPSYILQSSGYSSHMHGDLMGQYCLTGETINRYPVFKKTTYNLTFTLCVNGAGHWVVAYPPQRIGLVNTVRPTPRAPPFSGWTDTDNSYHSHTITLSPQ